MCDPDCSCDEYSNDDDYVQRRRCSRNKQNCKSPPPRQYHPDDPDTHWIPHWKKYVPPPRLDIHQPIRQSCKSVLTVTLTASPVVPYMMFHPQSSYVENFPAFPKAHAPTRPFIIPKKVLLFFRRHSSPDYRRRSAKLAVYCNSRQF